MNIPGAGPGAKTWMKYLDWKLLILLLLFLNVKLAVKVPAIVIVYLLQFDWKFGFRLKDSRLPFFYPLIIGVACLGYLLNKSFAVPAYNAVFLTGIVFWCLCLLAAHQVRLSVDRHTPETIHRTLVVFFILNAAVSALNLLVIIWEIKDINPYLYQGQYQKYFISTGDYIKGLTFDTSTTNAVINAMGLLYFFTKRSYLMTILCMITLLLTGSNFMNIIMVLLLAALFAFRSNRDQKSVVVICFMLLVVFAAKVSPQNQRYVNESFEQIFKLEKPHIAGNRKELPITERPDSLLSGEERREKIARRYLDSLNNIWLAKQAKKALPPYETEPVALPQPDIHGPYYQYLNIPLPAQRSIPQFIEQYRSVLPYATGAVPTPSLPGKLIGLIQTAGFMVQHPGRLLTGSGMGNFSSKLAFRATGLDIAGGYPQRYVYMAPDFVHNHLDLYLDFFSRQADKHSLTNTPFSVYDQLLSEYGLIGLLLFLVFYLGFFGKHYKQLTYGMPVLLLMMAVFFVDYWFEQLSVVILFELLLLLDLKEQGIQKGGPAHG